MYVDACFDKDEFLKAYFWAFTEQFWCAELHIFLKHFIKVLLVVTATFFQFQNLFLDLLSSGTDQDNAWRRI